jgi:hypothetical protein
MQRQAMTGVQPKTKYYQVDGTGRDLYIACDSGGHFKSNPHLGSRPSTASLRPRPASASRASLKSIHYQADGTGRDAYIQVTDGGLHGWPYRGMTVFSNSLRSYEKREVRTAGDYLAWSQGWMPARARNVRHLLRVKSQACVSRLSHSKPRQWL